MGIIDKWLQGEIREVPLEAVHRAMPQESVKEGERVVDTLSPKLRKIWTLSLAYGERAFHLRENGGDASDLRRAMATAETLKKFSWWLIRKEYGLWGDDEREVAVRSGWKLVICPQSPFSASPFSASPCSACILFNRWVRKMEAKIAKEVESRIAGPS